MSDTDIAVALSSGHDKQRALLTLDVATGRLASGDPNTAFGLARQALEEGMRLRSGKIVERARRLRRAYTASARPAMVREFDDLLHTAFL